MTRTEIEFYCPEELKGIPLEMGIDEAGRGPVLGPMLYCAAFAPLGFDWPSSVNDSKQIEEEKRISILAELKTLKIGFVIRSISAAEISATCLSRGSASLNSLSHETASNLVQRALDEGLDIQKLYVDTVGKEDKYQEWLQRKFPQIDVFVTAKGDAKFKCVGAASIQAKIRRDSELRDFQFAESNVTDREFGCGYPGDETTKRWLENSFDPVFGFPSIVRFSWSTAKQICDTKSPAYFDTPETPINDSSFFVSKRIRSVSLK